MWFVIIANKQWLRYGYCYATKTLKIQIMVAETRVQRTTQEAIGKVFPEETGSETQEEHRKQIQAGSSRCFTLWRRGSGGGSLRKMESRRHSHGPGEP